MMEKKYAHFSSGVDSLNLWHLPQEPLRPFHKRQIIPISRCVTCIHSKSLVMQWGCTLMDAAAAKPEGNVILRGWNTISRHES